MKEGELKVNRRPGTDDDEIDPSKFLPCIYCFGFMRKVDLWKHAKSCPFRPETQEGKKRGQLQGESALLLVTPIIPHDCKDQLVSHVLKFMQQDDITKVCQNDEVILTLGAAHLGKVGIEKSNNVSQRMRELSRLLIELRSLDPKGKHLADFIKPSKFDIVVSAVKNVCFWRASDEKQPSSFGTPSLALKLGNSLRKCAAVIRGIAIRRADKERKDEVNSYLELHDAEWAEKVTASALTTLHERKFNKPEILPLTSDLVKLRDFQLKELPRLVAELEKETTNTNWRKLAEVCLANTILGVAQQFYTNTFIKILFKDLKPMYKVL